MYVKKETIRYEKSLDLNDTFKFDELPTKGKSAGLMIVLEQPTNSGEHYSPANYDDKGRFIDWITKVQILVDGGRPLKDLNGPVAQALEYWNTGKAALDYLKDMSLGPDRCFIPIAFGRYLGDTEYHLDWSKYKSMELNLTNVGTDGPIDSITANIVNYAIIDAPAGLASKGVFQERIWRKYATVQNKREYFTPPIENKYRRMILRCVPDMSGSAPYRRIRNFDHLAWKVLLGYKAKAEIAFDGYGEQLMEHNMIEFPHPAVTGGYSLALTTGDATRTGIGYRTKSTVNHAEIASSINERSLGILTYSGDLMAVYTDNATNSYINWMASGFGYNNTLALLFDRYGPENYLDSVLKDPINLEIKTEDNANAAAGQIEIILSELVAK